MMLVSLDQAKKHLRIDGNDEDADLELKVHAASGAVLNYIDDSAKTFIDTSDVIDEDTAGDPLGVPYEIMAATLLMTGYLYRDRDNDSEKEFDRGYLPRPVTALLTPFRTPTLA